MRFFGLRRREKEMGIKSSESMEAEHPIVKKVDGKKILENLREISLHFTCLHFQFVYCTYIVSYVKTTI